MEVIRKGELHPLQNPCILERILKTLPVKDLKVCRLVCQEWRRIATKAMRSIAKVKITVENHNGEQGVDNFMTCVQNELSNFSESPLATAFELYGVVVGDQFEGFWEFCGKHIKHLFLRWITFRSVEAFRKAIFLHCPHLDKLMLCSVQVNGERTAMDQTEWVEPTFPRNFNLKKLEFHGSLYYLMSTVNLVELFAHFPALEELNADAHAARFKVDNIFKSLRSVRRHDRNLCKIKRLKCNFEEIGDPLIIASAFEDDQVALETLEAKRLRTAGDVQAVRRIWKANSGSLKIVFLRRSSSLDPTEELQLPIPENCDLKNLEDFSLVLWKLDSLSFLRSVPNLKILCLHLEELRDIGEMSGVVLPSCTELTLSIKNEPVEGEDMKKFCGWLPNVEKLRVFRTNNEIFALICEYWPKLKSLEMRSSDVDDAGICGWDSDDVDRVNRNGENVFWKPITVPRANLTCLQALQNFRYDLRNVEGIRLGYCAAVFGIKLLPELRHLQVSNNSATGRVWDHLRLQMAPKEDFRPLFDDWIE